MKRRSSSDTSAHIGVRLEQDVLDRVEAEAKRRMVSRQYVISRAIEQWLKENEGAAL